MASSHMNDEAHRILGRLEGKVDLMLVAVERSANRIDAIDKRVDGLEKDQHTSKTILAILGGIVGALATNFPTIFGWLTGKSA
jgi:hypothetical protein